MAQTPIPADKTVFTPNEVAELLMVSPITVRQWAQKGLIEAQTTAGGHRRFTLDAIRRFAAERDIDLSAVLPSTERTLLIVDDDAQLNRFLVSLFTAEYDDLKVYSAADGFEAGQLVQAHLPDVVLLDIMMPGLDGVEVCRRIKQRDDTCHARVVAMTGFHSEELEARVVTAGAVTLLKKPFDNDVVLTACGFELTNG